MRSRGFLDTAMSCSIIPCRWVSKGNETSFKSHAPLMILQWRHNECDGVSNYRHLDGLLYHLFRCRSKKTSKFRVTGLSEENSPVTCEFPSQRAYNTENVSIWWRHHGSRFWCAFWGYGLRFIGIACCSCPYSGSPRCQWGHSHIWLMYEKTQSNW